MRILKIIGFLLLVVVAIVAFLGWRAAGPYSVTESANIKGNTDVVWKNIADLKSFSDWNPWAKEDPNIKVTFNGDPMAVGSSYSWGEIKM
ncbi:MAG: hypothetical protein IPO27_09415 [Bacteroidetes bacterium]|nr:hypothetical protein [Bacteroidota bacterium]